MSGSTVRLTGMAKLWGGRFSAETDACVELLNNSLSFDQRMWRQDIRGSIAHATMLGETGIVTAEESSALVAGLRKLEADLDSGAVEFDPAAEDVHTAVESLLRERLGSVAGKLHTARSRNDQVATDIRLYLREQIDNVRARVLSLQEALLEIAERERDTVLPGFTHLQHAQPVLLAHHMLAYFWMLDRDRDRLADCRRRLNVLPLGAGALAGTTFPINRRRVAELLGFDDVVPNSMDAVADRDFAVEFLAAGALAMTHVSRLAEELILWNSPEFGFVELDDSVTTGSSIMPQKKNPDVAELARGKVGRTVGNLVALLTVIKGIPLTYNKDMQEDKEPVFDTVDTLVTLLPAFEKMLRTAQFRKERMAASLCRDFSTATDLADLLVRKGLPFRDAHAVVGRIVRACIESGIGLEDLDDARLAELAPEAGSGALDQLTVASSVAARRAEGGTAPEAVAEQLDRARRALQRG